MIKINKLYSLIVILFFGCTSKEINYTEKVVSLLYANNINVEDYSFIAIIPEIGCNGCISEAEHFFKENLKKDILFIFTKIQSKKEMELRLGKLLNRKNVIIDLEQTYASEKEEINIYPIIMDIRAKDKYEWRFLEPGISYIDVMNQF